ncbi:hypothetical protein GIW56_24525 [Pseudomonas gessardii]|uniref:Uncharacterized protein n=1 Tax=Pseudomonas gessardii TaxID=78544 RepID=A0ABS9FES8_9PSED|nr:MULTISPECIES: hypothetical protein [Pseudomonadaceae]MCF5097054.1 hypothetical protein [Pseudomonas gessardii]MCF5109985.1 hypothetical protein [Pseudomonas gessardii]MCQ4323121.1 hypothetical protein [Stutzerimonas stutzeri]
MIHNPQRLPLVTEIGLLAVQARVYSELDKQLPTNVTIDTHDDPRYVLTSDLWLDVLDGVIRLAEMDHRNNFTPETSPILSELGLLKEYLEARDRLDPEPEDPDDY